MNPMVFEGSSGYLSLGSSLPPTFEPVSVLLHT